MKREIKFRGKTVPDGRWVYGYYVVMENETKTVTRHAIMDLWDKENQYIKDGKSYHMSVSVVEADTVGQFTGLRDKNGKEIYDGDIVRYHMHGRGIHESEYQTGLVEFGGGRFYADLDCSTLYFCGDSEDYEVIGNKWDNPELLKGGEKWI